MCRAYNSSCASGPMCAVLLFSSWEVPLRLRCGNCSQKELAVMLAKRSQLVMDEEIWPSGKYISTKHTYNGATAVPWLCVGHHVSKADTWSSCLYYILTFSGMHIDPRIFTVVQLKFYLKCHDVLVKRPASYRQPELFRLYSKHLANRPWLYPYQFDWPGM